MRDCDRTVEKIESILDKQIETIGTSKKFALEIRVLNRSVIKVYLPSVFHYAIVISSISYL